MRLIVKRVCDYGSYPWAIVDKETNHPVQAPPVEFNHPDLGSTVIGGAIFYRFKHEAQQVLNSWNAR